MFKRFVILLCLLTAGCGNPQHSPVPVPIGEATPFSYQGKIGLAWGGDNFEVIEDGYLHYAFVRGIDTPEPGQDFFEEAKQMLLDLTGEREVTINVVQRDQWKREICDLHLTNQAGVRIEPAVILLERGLAWYDKSDVPMADEYSAAESAARSKKIGIWSRPNPVPPWEHWALQLQKMRKADVESNE